MKMDMPSFYLAGTDYSGLTIPRKCDVLETVCWFKSEKVLRVQIDYPLRPEPLGLREPIKELLLSFLDTEQSFVDIGRKAVMVNIFVPTPPAIALESAPLRIGIGTLHKTFEDALGHSSLYKEERQKWLDGSLSSEERQKWLDGLM